MLPVALCWSLGKTRRFRITASCTRLDPSVCIRLLYHGRNDYGQAAAPPVLDSREIVLQR